MSRLLDLLKRPWFAVLIGLILLSLFIWFLGPYFAFADFKPFASATARLVIIVLLFLGWVIWIQIRQLMNARKSDQMAQQVAAPAAAGGAAPSADAQQLRDRFAEAVAALKKSSKSGASLYELPWYVIIGPPGSGKTTVIANSGLNFPLSQKYGKEAVRGVGGTRNCDWWFTDEAVLLDTAGRYTTQDSDRRSDSAGWIEFLKLLKRYRKRRPVNGVIVALSASDLMTQGEAGVQAHVLAVRARLDELNQQFGVQMPVYVMFSKCDLIAGFGEYFDDLDADSRLQVWGTTFPLEASYAGKAVEAFGAEYDLLLERVQARVLARMDAERDVRRRSVIFSFPAQLGAFKPLAEKFLNGVFATTSFDDKSLLRGVYLTSGTQVGNPIDRLIGAVARTFGLDAPGLTRGTAQGRAYFIQRLFRQVMFNEAGLAGTNRKLELRKALVQLGAYVGVSLLTVLGIALMWISYARNSNYLQEVSNAFAQYQQAVKTEVADAATRLSGIVPRLDAMANVVTVARQHDKDGAPWSMRWGLYQGRATGVAADDAYQRELNARLLPLLAARFRSWLDRFSAQPLELYEALRLYLMLGETQRLEPETATAVANAEVAREFAGDRATRDALSIHVGALFDEPARVRGTQLDQPAIGRARSALQVASVPALIYNRIQSTYREDERALVLDRNILNLGTVFKRNSGTPWTDPVPALYTSLVFNEVSRLGAPGVIARFAPEPWVLGEVADNAKDRTREAYTAMALYEQDYIRYWDALLADTRLNTAGDFKQTLYMLGSQTSPLKGLLTEVRKQTDLIAASGGADKAAEAARKAAEQRLGSSPLAKGLVGAAKAEGLIAQEEDGARVTRHFLPIHRLTQGAPGSQPIDRVIALIAQAHNQLAATGSDFGQASTVQALAGGAGSVFQNLQNEAKQLPGPVAQLVTGAGQKSVEVARGEAGGEVEKRLQEQVLRDCQAIVGAGYPFKAGADVPPADFGRLFGTNGLLDSFFNQTLAAMVDRSTKPWSMRDGAAPVAPQTLRAFEHAERIRAQYFRSSGADPEVRFTLTPQSLSSSVGRFIFEYDGKRFEYRHEAPQSWPMVWPPTGGDIAAVTFEELSGEAIYSKFEGAWGLFRLLQAGRVDPRSNTDFTVTLQAQGREVQLRLAAASLNNPFRSPGELATFRCPG